jgi:putative spermidine/putrescine transport system substrate-binding protein
MFCLRNRCCALYLKIVLVALLGMSHPALAVETLRILTWPGYADPDLVKAFEQRHGVRVEVTQVGNDDVLRARMAAGKGAHFDVFAANTAEMVHYFDAGLIQPIDMHNIPNSQRQQPRFSRLSDIPGITHSGKVYAIPYTYAEMGLIYDRRQFKTAPTSLSILWDPRYAGKVLLFEGGSHNFSLAALSLGLGPFRIPPAEARRVLNRLLALRRNALAFYSLPEEATQLFREQSAALLFANYGSQQVKQLRDAGADVGYVVPREGALAWLDCWAISRGARNKTLAEAWINYTLEPTVSHALTQRQELANTLEASDTAHANDHLIWLEPVEDDAWRTRLWQRIISGEREARLVP